MNANDDFSAFMVEEPGPARRFMMCGKSCDASGSHVKFIFNSRHNVISISIQDAAALGKFLLDLADSECPRRKTESAA